MQIDLSGKTAIVTGSRAVPGAGKGIGRHGRDSEHDFAGTNPHRRCHNHDGRSG
jgi:hypothetical protein